MTTWVANVLKTCETECGRLADKVLRTRNTRNQSPQNICNSFYDTQKIAIEKPIVFSIQTPFFENIIFLRGCGDLRGLF